MAYTSDLRIKNYLKDIDIRARTILNEYKLDSSLYLRVFDESNEDAIPWEKGGLAFNDPKTNRPLGSNDAGWFIDDKIPLLIVEGTYATERGQFGDGQLNRFSHSLGVALNGYLGITVVPFKGQSFIKKGFRNDISVKNINYANGLLHKGMVTGALNVSKTEKGKFLIIDPYEPDLLLDLLVNATLNYHKVDNELDKCISKILAGMVDYLGVSIYGKRSTQTISSLADVKGNILSKSSRFYTQNIAALTTSTKRDGHGLLGKNLVFISSSPDTVYSIFIRLDDSDIETLKARKSKEFTYLLNHPKICVKCFDDLGFKDTNLATKVKTFRQQNLHTNTEKALIKEIQQAFNNGVIYIKR